MAGQFAEAVGRIIRRHPPISVIDRAIALLEEPSPSVFAYIEVAKYEQIEAVLGNGLPDIEVLAVGSSYAQFAFEPGVFGKAYNSGVCGMVQIDRQYGLLKRLLRKCEPKTIIYFADDLGINCKLYRQKLRPIFHGLKSEAVLRRGVAHSFDKMVQDDWKIPAHKPVAVDLSPFSDYEGYELHDNGWVEGKANSSCAVTESRLVFSPRPDAVDFLRRLFGVAGQRLVVTTAPLQAEYTKAGFGRVESSWNFVKNMALGLGIPVADVTDFPCDRPDLFFDAAHLNARGARLFSQRLAHEIEKCRL